MTDESIQEHWNRARSRYEGFDSLTPAQQHILLDYTYMGVNAPNFHRLAREGQPVESEITLKNDRRERLMRELFRRMTKSGSSVEYVKKKLPANEINLEDVGFEYPEYLGDGITWFITDPNSVLVSVPDGIRGPDEEKVQAYFADRFDNVEVDAEVRAGKALDADTWFPDMEKLAEVLPAERLERVKTEEYEQCPHCGEEIREKSTFCPRDEDGNFKEQDGQMVMVHRPCGGEYISEPREYDPSELSEFGRKLLQEGLI
jgi:hypothetical protein